MQTGTLIMMVLVLGTLWGGFASLLICSMKADKRRTTAPSTNGANGE
jgi:hypothetical protein